MKTYIFDIETNGFVKDLDRIHSIVIKDVVSGLVHSCFDCDQPDTTSIDQGLHLLSQADMLVGHNIIDFDLPAIKKVFPAWETKAVIRDTYLMSQLIWPELRNDDYVRIKRNALTGEFPKKFIGRHSLEAWGHRLSEYKVGLDITDWSKWTPYMQERCEQDVEVNEELWRLIVANQYNENAVTLEHDFAKIIQLQVTQGFDFDERAAVQLYAKLCHRRDEISEDLSKVFAPWHAQVGLFTPKRDNKARGYTKGVQIMKTKLVHFNPGSRDHIADRLMKVHGWKPTEFTPGGKPQVDETVLSGLPYPEAAILDEYLTTAKIIGYLGEGKNAWLKLAKGGRIHGRVKTLGAVTRRCTHLQPNISQVPTTQKLYGKECRSLFVASPGYRLVGVDAMGLELRCLAHYMHRYDGGAYAKTVIHGTKADFTDQHSAAAYALGLDPARDYVILGKRINGRELAKRWVYAFLYGAGDGKLGALLGKGAREGKRLRALFLKNFPAMDLLKKQLTAIVSRKGCIKGIDGGKIHVRSLHSALNTLLQSAGAIAMKKALVLLYNDLSAQGWVHGDDYAFVANVHDEIQANVKENHVNAYKVSAVQAIRDAGQELGFLCPLDGNAKDGANWAETH